MKALPSPKSVPFLLALLTVLLYLPTLGNGFLDWDDQTNFLTNTAFRGLGWSPLAWAFKTRLLGVYQPLAWLLATLEHALFGLNAWGYHLTSNLLHAANTAVLYLVAAKLVARAQPPAQAPARLNAPLTGPVLAALLFAIHPLRVEAVAWASAQPYLICTLFYLLAVLVYLETGLSAARRWVLTGLFFVAALLSKAPAVTLPAVLLILDRYPLRRRLQEAWLEKLPFFALSALFAWIAITAKDSARMLTPLEHYGLLPRLAQACHSVWFYPLKTVFPFGLSIFYGFPEPMSPLAPEFASAILATVLVSAALGYLRKKHPGGLALWLGYLVILAPVSGLVSIGSQLAADRYSYLAAAALSLGVAGLLSSTRRLLAVRAAGAAWLVVMAALTWQQTGYWKTTEILIDHARASGDRLSPEIRNWLGQKLTEQGKLDEATVEFQEALRVKPAYAQARGGLGVVLSRKGRQTEAATEFVRALEARPDLPELHNGYGIALGSQGRFDEATAEFNRALAVEPGNAAAHYNLGTTLAQQGRIKEALPFFERAVALNGEDADARTNLGLALSRLGRHDEARAAYREALRLRPGDPELERALRVEP